MSDIKPFILSTLLKQPPTEHEACLFTSFVSVFALRISLSPSQQLGLEKTTTFAQDFVPETNSGLYTCILNILFMKPTTPHPPK